MQLILFDDRRNLTDAVRDGKKTLTRRNLKNQTGNLSGFVKYTRKGSDLTYVRADFDNGISEDYRYKIGEVVAVAQSYTAIYREAGVPSDHSGSHQGWNNKMFVKANIMPLRIKIIDIRPERLQDISDQDCLKEGVSKSIVGYFVRGMIANWQKESHTEHEDGKCYKLFPTPREAFATLIDKVSRRGTWAKNPYVWRIEFELIETF